VAPDLITVSHRIFDKGDSKMKSMKATWISLVLFSVLAGGIVLAGCGGGGEEETTTNTTTTKTDDGE